MEPRQRRRALPRAPACADWELRVRDRGICLCCTFRSRSCTFCFASCFRKPVLDSAVTSAGRRRGGGGRVSRQRRGLIPARVCFLTKVTGDTCSLTPGSVRPGARGRGRGCRASRHHGPRATSRGGGSAARGGPVPRPRPTRPLPRLSSPPPRLRPSSFLRRGRTK